MTEHPSARAPTFLKAQSPSLVFIHGRLGQAQMWKVLAEKLARDFRCLTMDLPGYGRSFSVDGEAYSLLESTNLVLALIQQLTSAHEKVIVIGHDVGGSIAQLVALRIPERISGIVLINSACLTRKLNGLHPHSWTWMMGNKVKKLLSVAKNLTEEDLRLLWQPWKEKRLRTALVKSFRTLEESWPWHYERQIWKEAVEGMRPPALVLWGEQDLLNPKEIGSELVQRLPEAYFYMSKNSSHWPCLEEPEWVISKTRDFLFKIEDQQLRGGRASSAGQRSPLR